MNKKETKTFNISISIETWKKIKKLAIDKDLTLANMCKELLEKSCANKKASAIEVSEESV